MKSDNTRINFSINSWDHLYSLKAAIEKRQQEKGKTLTIAGNLRNNPMTDHQDTPILIALKNVQGTPEYQTNPSGETILGCLRYQHQQLQTELAIDDAIFEELRKNLMEYSDIDGIHIVISIKLEGKPDINTRQAMNILDLTYAMKGDT